MFDATTVPGSLPTPFNLPLTRRETAFIKLQVHPVLQNSVPNGRSRELQQFPASTRIAVTGEAMAGNARRKIDSYTQQMFDPEVDKPEHDDILTKLYEDDDAIAQILTDLHRLPQLPRFDERSVFTVVEQRAEYGRVLTPERSVSLSEAVALTGSSPKRTSLVPVRIEKKQIEVLVYLYSNEGRSERLMGFVDLGVQYSVIGTPRLAPTSNGKCTWLRTSEKYLAMFEVKSAWPTAGNLLRQLNLYRVCHPKSLEGYSRTNLVVGPDDSLIEVTGGHGYRTVTFNGNWTEFKLLPHTPPARRSDDEL